MNGRRAVGTRLVLAYLASIGVMYVFLAPVITSGLIGLGAYTATEAGIIVSANLFGTAAGGVVTYFLITQFSWKRIAFLTLLGVITADLLTIYAQNESYQAMLWIRAMQGLAGGTMVASVVSAIARFEKADQTFALLMLLQLLIGGVVVAALTAHVQSQGPQLIWVVLAVFSSIGLFLVGRVSDLPHTAASHAAAAHSAHAPWLVIIAAMSALFLFQAAELGVFTYVIELGVSRGYPANDVGLTLAGSYWIGVPVALAVAWQSNQGKRLIPLAFTLILSTTATAAMLIGAFSIYTISVIALGACVAAGVPYLLGLMADMDQSGRMATLGSVVSNLGLAVGPLAGALVLVEGSLNDLLYVATAAFIICLCTALFASVRNQGPVSPGGRC